MAFLSSVGNIGGLLHATHMPPLGASNGLETPLPDRFSCRNHITFHTVSRGPAGPGEQPMQDHGILHLNDAMGSGADGILGLKEQQPLFVRTLGGEEGSSASLEISLPEGVLFRCLQR